MGGESSSRSSELTAFRKEINLSIRKKKYWDLNLNTSSFSVEENPASFLSLFFLANDFFFIRRRRVFEKINFNL